MKRFLAFIVIAVIGVFFPGCSLAQTVVVPTVAKTNAQQLLFQIVEQYPHDSSAFTEGLFWNDGNLYESTGLLGQSTLRKVDLKTGKVLLQHRLPNDIFGEGIAEMNGKLVQLTWQQQYAFVYNSKNFTFEKNFNYQGEGWGLTTDGKYWISSNGSDTLTWRDESTFAQQCSIHVTWNGEPVKNLNELEWIDGKIWANVWYTNYILQIDPQSGKVLSYIDITSLVSPNADPENVPNGIAYDSVTRRIFITGKRWSKIYEIQLK
jgi:glutaminyl-peptide cyclotransferase